MTINVIGMSHGEQEPMESGRYHDIIHCDNIHQKYTGRSLPSIYIFWFDFSKAINLY